MSVMEIVVSAQDRASDVIEGIGETADSTSSWMQDNWMKVGAATAGAGAALEGFARSQAPANEQTRRLAAGLGMTEDSVRDMAVGLSNVTFPLDDVLGLLETGRQRGLESAEALEAYATTWDTIGDATGLSGPALAEAAVALETLGISAGQEEQAMAAFGYITDQTTSDVGEFLGIIERVGPDLNAMGGDVDDAAAILGILEKEFGLSGSAARREFQSAIREADGDMDAMLGTLGISTDMLGDYRGQVQEASDVIQRNADIHADSYTPIERMSHAAQELMYQYGGLADVAGMAAPVLMAVGPIMGGISTATRALSGAMTFLAANPIVLVIAAVAALAAGLVYAYRNSETFRNIVDSVFRTIGNAGRWLWESMIKPAFDGITGGFDTVMTLARRFGDVWDSIMRAAGRGVDLMTAPFRTGVNVLGGGVERVVNGVASAINRMPSFTVPNWVPGIGGNSFSLPNVPTISIPRLHSGGMFRAAGGGGEGLALLRDREVVTTPEQQDAQTRLLGALIEEVRSLRGAMTDARPIVVNGQDAHEVARALESRQWAAARTAGI